MVPLPGRPKLIMEGRGRRGARMSLASDWFDLDKDGLIARLKEFGLADGRAEHEAQAFLDYRAKLREATEKTEPETETDLDEVAREWQESLKRRISNG